MENMSIIYKFLDFFSGLTDRQSDQLRDYWKTLFLNYSYLHQCDAANQLNIFFHLVNSHAALECRIV